MFPNLKAEMARHNVTRTQILKELHITSKSFSNKMSGTTEFTLSEVQKIKKLFPNLTLEYLFDDNQPE